MLSGINICKTEIYIRLFFFSQHKFELEIYKTFLAAHICSCSIVRIDRGIHRGLETKKDVGKCFRFVCCSSLFCTLIVQSNFLPGLLPKFVFIITLSENKTVCL
jgi:hypothetical protein